MCVKIKNIGPLKIYRNFHMYFTNKNNNETTSGVVRPYWYINKVIQSPTELGNVYGVNLVSDEGSVIVETSPYVYVKRVLESGDSRLQNLCKAMWAYGQAAREYEK